MEVHCGRRTACRAGAPRWAAGPVPRAAHCYRPACRQPARPLPAGPFLQLVAAFVQPATPDCNSQRFKA